MVMRLENNSRSWTDIVWLIARNATGSYRRGPRADSRIGMRRRNPPSTEMLFNMKMRGTAHSKGKSHKGGTLFIFNQSKCQLFMPDPLGYF